MVSKFIKPSVFKADPNSKQASKEWRHWYCTFSEFVNSFPAEPAISNEDKLKCLIAHIIKDVYDYVSECRTYQEAIQTLERLWDSFASPGPAGVGAISLAETVTSRPSGDRTTA